MTTEIVDITMREYTEDGRLVVVNMVVDVPFHRYREEVRDILEDKQFNSIMDRLYKQNGLMDTKEVLKPLWKTNVSVRHPGTGRFLSF